MPSINKIKVNGTDYDVYSPEIYSTKEQVIGTWIDDKPIYRKVIQGSITPEVYHTYIETIADFGDLVRVYSYLANPEDGRRWSGYLNATVFSGVEVQENGQLEVFHPKYTSSQLFNVTIIVEYTKTTD